jgi:hypothetical protein
VYIRHSISVRQPWQPDPPDGAIPGFAQSLIV